LQDSSEKNLMYAGISVFAFCILALGKRHFNGGVNRKFRSLKD